MIDSRIKEKSIPIPDGADHVALASIVPVGATVIVWGAVLDPLAWHPEERMWMRFEHSGKGVLVQNDTNPGGLLI